MLKNKKITVTIILFLAVIFLLPQLVSAQAEYGVNDLINSGARLARTDLRTLIANIINVFLGFLGVIGVVIVMYGGFKWMTSGGLPQKIEEAKKIIINGAIGLVIILAAYGIVRLAFQIATGEFFAGGPGGGGPPSGYSGGVGLGGGALESHYPARNASGVPRNTMIYVTFKEPIELATILANGACLLDCDSSASNIQLVDLNNNLTLANTDLIVNYSADRRTFEFNPYGNSAVNHLGIDNAQVRYQMVLDGLQTGSGRAAFPITGFYDWNFTVSTELDLTPPTVVSVLPVANSNNNPRNSAVQINFSEAVIPNGPSGATGRYDPPADNFINIEVRDAAAATVRGEYQISNQYRTVEFITDALCGQNSCGGNVYCLPGGQQISAVVKGLIRDMAANTLDGNDNGSSEGSPADDHNWNFATNNAVDLSAPVVSSMSPNNNVSMLNPIEVVFTKDLLSSSINSSNITLVEDPNIALNYWLNLPNSNTVHINHDKFKPLTVYHPGMYSGIKDTLQNCWFTCRCDDPGGSCTCDRPGACVGNVCETNSP